MRREEKRGEWRRAPAAAVTALEAPTTTSEGSPKNEAIPALKEEEATATVEGRENCRLSVAR